MSEELKKYCLEKAFDAGGNLQLAQEIYSWMQEDQVRGVDREGRVTNAHMRPVYRDWQSKALTKAQKIVLSAAIEMHKNGEKISGVRLDMKLKITCSTMHLRHLVKAGYMRRDGNKWWPVRLPNGDDLPPVLTKLPAAPAVGYKMGDIARIVK